MPLFSCDSSQAEALEALREVLDQHMLEKLARAMREGNLQPAEVVRYWGFAEIYGRQQAEQIERALERLMAEQRPAPEFPALVEIVRRPSWLKRLVGRFFSPVGGTFR